MNNKSKYQLQTLIESVVTQMFWDYVKKEYPSIIDIYVGIDENGIYLSVTTEDDGYFGVSDFNYQPYEYSDDTNIDYVDGKSIEDVAFDLISELGDMGVSDMNLNFVIKPMQVNIYSEFLELYSSIFPNEVKQLKDIEGELTVNSTEIQHIWESLPHLFAAHVSSHSDISAIVSKQQDGDYIEIWYSEWSKPSLDNAPFTRVL